MEPELSAALVGAVVALLIAGLSSWATTSASKKARREHAAEVEKARQEERWRDSRAASIELDEIYGDIAHAMREAVVREETGDDSSPDALVLADTLWNEDTRKRTRHLRDQLVKPEYREALDKAERQDRLYRRLSPQLPEGYRMDWNSRIVTHAHEVASSYSRGEDSVPPEPSFYSTVDSMSREEGERVEQLFHSLFEKRAATGRRFTETLFKEHGNKKYPNLKSD